jgi:hypothetical protein
MSYKIALTSSDGKQADLHFGHTGVFHILQVDEETGNWEPLEQRFLPGETEAAPDESHGCLGHNDERLNSVIALLSDCRYLLTARIGKKPHTLLQRSGITALECQEDLSGALTKLHLYHLKYTGINKEK